MDASLDKKQQLVAHDLEPHGVREGDDRPCCEEEISYEELIK